MRLINTILFLSLVHLSIANATSRPTPGAPASQPTVVYTQGHMAVIMELRARGESLASVAKAVGGTREDVRAAERAELARRKTRS